MPKISVITPSVREDMLAISKKALKRQNFDDFEWIVSSPFEYKDAIWVKDPGKNDGDYYSLNKAYNVMLCKAQGELIISFQDGLDLSYDCLTRFWSLFTHINKRGCIGAVGDQYLSLDPPIKVWQDPRRRTDFGSFYEINPIDLEFTLCAFPRTAAIEAGGFDEEYDKGAAVSEKELAMRMDKLGYKFYIDQLIEYKALKHPRLSQSWDDHYNVACDIFARHLHQLEEGTRDLKQPFLDKCLLDK